MKQILPLFASAIILFLTVSASAKDIMSFTIHGVKPGMTLDEARQKLTEAGFDALPPTTQRPRLQMRQTDRARNQPTPTTQTSAIFRKPGMEINITRMQFGQNNTVVQRIYEKVKTSDYESIKSRLQRDLGEPTPMIVKQGQSEGITGWTWGERSSRYVEIGQPGNQKIREVVYGVAESRKSYLSKVGSQ